MRFSIFRTISWFIKFTTTSSVCEEGSRGQAKPEEPPRGASRGAQVRPAWDKTQRNLSWGSRGTGTPLKPVSAGRGGASSLSGRVTLGRESWGRCQALGCPRLPRTVGRVVGAFQGCIGKKTVQAEIRGVLPTRPPGRPVCPSFSESSGWSLSVVSDQRRGWRRGPLSGGELLLPETWQPPNSRTCG